MKAIIKGARYNVWFEYALPRKEADPSGDQGSRHFEKVIENRDRLLK